MHKSSSSLKCANLRKSFQIFVVRWLYFSSIWFKILPSNLKADSSVRDREEEKGNRRWQGKLNGLHINWWGWLGHWVTWKTQDSSLAQAPSAASQLVGLLPRSAQRASGQELHQPLRAAQKGTFCRVSYFL